MPTHGRPRPTPGDPVGTRIARRTRASRLRRLRRKLSGPAILLLVVIVAFCAALLLWTRGGPDDTALPPLHLPTAPAAGTGNGSVSGGAVDDAPSASGEDDSTGSGGAVLPTGPLAKLPSDDVHTFHPGEHTVVLTAEASSGKLHALAYEFRGQHPSAAIYNVRTPFRKSGYVGGVNRLAAIGIQVDGGGGTATCTVAVDGRTVVRHSASGAGAVALCGV